MMDFTTSRPVFPHRANALLQKGRGALNEADVADGTALLRAATALDPEVFVRALGIVAASGGPRA